MDRPNVRSVARKRSDDENGGLPPPVAAMVRSYSGCKDLIRSYSGNCQDLLRTCSTDLLRTCSTDLLRSCSKDLLRTCSGDIKIMPTRIQRTSSLAMAAQPVVTPTEPLASTSIGDAALGATAKACSREALRDNDARISQNIKKRSGKALSGNDAQMSLRNSKDQLVETLDKKEDKQMGKQKMQEFTSLSSFYLYYQSEHQQTGTRVLHFLGTTLFIVLCLASVVAGSPRLCLLGVVCGYFCAWVGHFCIERNRPATFKYPIYSLMSDFIMYKNIIAGKESF